MAILAGDALLTLAFEVLAKLDGVDDRRRARMMAELATASGTVGGMIGGQVFDLEGERQDARPPNCSKPSTAPRPAPCCAPACAWAPSTPAPTGEQYDALSCYGEHVGLAFQIVDDMLDVEQSSEALGQDRGQGRRSSTRSPSRPSTAWRSRAAWPSRSARARTTRWRSFGERAARLHELADLIVHRKS